MWRIVSGTGTRRACQLHMAQGVAYAPQWSKRCRPHLKAMNRVTAWIKPISRCSAKRSISIEPWTPPGKPSIFCSQPNAMSLLRSASFEKHFALPVIRYRGVINVAKYPAYPCAIRALKGEGTLPPRVRLRQCKYINNIVEQSHGRRRRFRGCIRTTKKPLRVEHFMPHGSG